MQFAQDIRKDLMMKKKTISVTESLSELSSMAQLTRVQAEYQHYMNASAYFQLRVFSSFCCKFSDN